MDEKEFKQFVWRTFPNLGRKAFQLWCRNDTTQNKELILPPTGAELYRRKYTGWVYLKAKNVSIHNSSCAYKNLDNSFYKRLY